MLEDALTTLHASKGGADGAVHPLLVDGEDFTAGVDDPQPPNSTRRMGEPWEVLDGPSDGKTPGANPDVIDAFGTLSISDHGISRFFGPTGGSEVRPFFIACRCLFGFLVLVATSKSPGSLMLPFRS
ncbi:Zn(2)-C6 fungal-type domain-containing protein [Mycena sanguinolenta]|uniref:Zn(2)-C6 fungal-type domain-containing protein n=1 Tax=Mycena sanguinolenta TaxID=230812 RepID=A0A8H6U4D9_9AGAR|nr:Zn(2)-C6 fungal-type domain-containing protein [Mycena sanguinolenta]